MLIPYFTPILCGFSDSTNRKIICQMKIECEESHHISDLKKPLLIIISSYSLGREDLTLNSGWIQSCQRILEKIKDLEKTEEKDRLEYVRSIRFMLGARQRSIVGWMQWINNPDIMTRFSEEEHREMNKRIAEFTQAFIKYDMEITKKGEEKGLEVSRRARRGSRGREAIYI